MLGRILVFFGGLIVVALTAALLVPYFVDWTNFRTDFETQASRIIGKKVVVHGTVDARLLPFPSVTMSDVRVGQDEEGEALVTVAHFSMDAELAPFLSGEAKIYNMRVDQPKLRLKLNTDGTLDWMRTGKPLIPASSVILEQVVITNGSIEFIDQQTGRTRHAEKLNASLSAKTLAGPWRINGDGVVDGEKADFSFAASTPDDSGSISLKSRILPQNFPVIVELEGVIKAVDLKPRYAGRFDLRQRQVGDKSSDDPGETAKPTSAPRISGQFELGNDRIRIPAYDLNLGNPADPYVISGEATLDTGLQPEFLLTANGQQIDMTRFGPQTDDGKTVEGTALPLSARLQALMAVASDIPIPEVPGHLTVTLPAIVAGDTTIRDIRLDMQPDGKGWLIDKAAFLLPGRTTLEANGRLNLVGEQSFSGDLLLASTQPSGFAEWVAGGVPASIRVLKTAGFSAHVNLTPDLQRFEKLEIAMGQLALKGRMERVAAVGDKPPALSVDLTGDGFDLETIQGLAGLMTGDSSPAALLNHQLAAKLTLGSFSAYGLDASDVKTVLTVADGTIKIDRLEIGDLAGAAISAIASVSDFAGTPKGNARASISSADPTAFFALLVKKLPPHPVLSRLAANAGYFSDTDIKLDVRAGDGDWPIEANLSGTSNGTTLSVRYAAQSASLEKSGGMALDVSLENDNVPVLFGQMGLPALPFDVVPHAAVELHVSEDADTDPQATFTFSAEGTSVTVEGQTSLVGETLLEGSYQLKVDSTDFEPFLMMGGVAMPQMGTGLPLTLHSTVYVTPESVVLESLNGSADTNLFSGNLTLNRGAAPIRVEGDMTLDRVDLGWLAETIFGPVAGADGQLLKTAMHAPLDSGIESLVNLTAGQLEAGSLPPVSDATAIINQKTGSLKITGLRGKFADGRLAGQMEFGNASGEGLFRARMDLTDADLAGLIAATGQTIKVKGRSDVSLVLEASGKSVFGLSDNASGSGAVNLSGLTVEHVNQAALPLILGEADRMNGDVSEAGILPFAQRHLNEGAFIADAVKIPFTIAGGTLRAQNILVENDHANVSANAEVSLPDGSLHANVRLSFNAGEAALAGAEPAITLAWHGRVSDPGTSLDVTELTNYLSLRKFEIERRRVEILQASLMEKQRLRREAALYKAREKTRQAERETAAAQERLLKQAQEILRAKAIEEQAIRDKNRAEQQSNPADDGVIRGGDLPAPAQ